MTNKRKLNRRKNKFDFYMKVAIIFTLVSSILAGSVFLLNFKSSFGKTGEQVVLKNSFYTLRGNPTPYQKDLFKSLSTQLEKNIPGDLDAVSLVVENFIADYYTWSNKMGAYDVGGRDFIMSFESLNFYQTSRRYIYSNIENYLSNGYAMTDLPEVESIVITSSNYAAGYVYYDQTFTAYYVEATWMYKENTKIDMSVFPTKGYFTLISNADGRYEIVRFY